MSVNSCFGEHSLFPAGTCLLEVNDETTEQGVESLQRKQIQLCQWRLSGIFIFNFEEVSHNFELLFFTCLIFFKISVYVSV